MRRHPEGAGEAPRSPHAVLRAIVLAQLLAGLAAKAGGVRAFGGRQQRLRRAGRRGQLLFRWRTAHAPIIVRATVATRCPCPAWTAPSASIPSTACCAATAS